MSTLTIIRDSYSIQENPFKMMPSEINQENIQNSIEAEVLTILKRKLFEIMETDKSKKKIFDDIFEIKGFGGIKKHTPRVALSIGEEGIKALLYVWENGERGKIEDGAKAIAVAHRSIPLDIVKDIKNSQNHILPLANAMLNNLATQMSIDINTMIEKGTTKIKESQKITEKNNYIFVKENMEEQIKKQNYSMIRGLLSEKENLLSRKAFTNITGIEFGKDFPSLNKAEIAVLRLERRENEEGWLFKNEERNTEVETKETTLRARFNKEKNETQIYVKQKGAENEITLCSFEGKMKDEFQIEREIRKNGWTGCKPPLPEEKIIKPIKTTKILCK